MLRSLIRKTVRDHRRSTLGWGLGMAALTLMQLAVYLNVHSQGAKMRDLINSYPSAFKAMFGMEGVDFTSGLGYLSTETSSLLAPLMLIGLGIALGTGAIATEEEHGTLDLLMASPVSRGRVLAAKALGSFAALVAIATVLYLTVLITANVARRSLPAGFTVISYFIDSLAEITSAVRPWRVVSVFHQASPVSALLGDIGITGVLATAAVAVACCSATGSLS